MHREFLRTIGNAGAASLQVVGTAVVMVVLYGYLIRHLGAADLGVWSTVMAASAVGGVANFGLVGAAARFVAKYRAHADLQRAAWIVETNVLAVAVAVAAALLLAFPLLRWGLRNVMESDDARSAIAVLPFGLFSFWTTSVALVLYSALDGCERVDIRAAVTLTGSVVQLVAVLVLVPRNGLMGLAWGQVLQGLVVIVVGWIVLKRVLPGLPFLPVRWRSTVLREVLGFSVGLQCLTFLRLALDPLSKWYCTMFAGVDATGYLEMANRIVVQLRAVIVAAHQALLPQIVRIQTTRPDAAVPIYRTSLRLSGLAVACLLPFGLVSAKGLSAAWIGTSNSPFVPLYQILLVGWFLNIIANPAYFGFLARGSVGPPLWSHAVMACLNAAMGAVVGSRAGSAGVACSLAAALVVGSVVLSSIYHASLAVPIRDIFTLREALPFLAAVGCGTVVTAVAVEYWGEVAPKTVLSTCAIAYVVAILPFLPRAVGWAPSINPLIRPRT